MYKRTAIQHASVPELLFLNAQNDYFHNSKISELWDTRVNLRPNLDSLGQNLLSFLKVIQNAEMSTSVITIFSSFSQNIAIQKYQSKLITHLSCLN
jgi:hypothetical protein